MWPLVAGMCVGLAGAVLYTATRRRRRAIARIEGLVRRAEALVSEPGGGTPLRSADPLARLEHLLETLAQRIAERDALRRTTEAQKELDVQIHRAFDMAESEPRAFEVTGRALAAVLPDVPAEMLLADLEKETLHVAAISSTGLFPSCPVEATSGCIALRRAQTMRFADSDAIDACPSLRGRPDGRCAATCVPVSVMGRAIGVLHVTTPFGVPLPERSEAGLDRLATHLGTRLGMLHALETFQEQAATDALTGLPNRRHFEDRGKRLLASAEGVAVVLCDVDHFKKLNDGFGHDVGDRALKLFAKTLRSALRPRDLVARIGGEEFAIVLPACGPEGAEAALGRCRSALARALASTDLPPFTASFGVACGSGRETSLEHLLGAADRAMYESKASGRDRVTVAGKKPANAS